MTLAFDPTRKRTNAIPAATVLVLRQGTEGLEVFCVERSKKSPWLGGVVVFPGGKVAETDEDDAKAIGIEGGTNAEILWAAARETFEEAAVFPGPVSHEQLLAWRSYISAERSLKSLVMEYQATIDVAKLIPFARWVTPVGEARRFDTHFFLLALPDRQQGHHDDTETVASFWGRPADILRDFNSEKLVLVPPTHRSLSVLATFQTVEEALAKTRASPATRRPICPVLTNAAGTVALTLPGDPEHPEPVAIVPGPSRFVLRGARWLPESAPTPGPAT
jgi:8-oxo-dGTP pyrophosphatase MutT (NUDIX family)